MGQGAQVNPAVLGDGKVFMRCTSDILGGVLARPTADYVAQGREGACWDTNERCSSCKLVDQGREGNTLPLSQRRRRRFFASR